MIVSLVVPVGVDFSLGVLEVVPWLHRIGLFSIDREGILGPGGGMRRSDILRGGILDGVRGILPQEFQDIQMFLSFLVEFLIADGRPLPLDALVHIWIGLGVLLFSSWILVSSMDMRLAFLAVCWSGRLWGSALFMILFILLNSMRLCLSISVFFSY